MNEFNEINTDFNCLHRNGHVKNLIGSKSSTVPGWTMEISAGSPNPSTEDTYRDSRWKMEKCFNPYTWWGEHPGTPSGYIRTNLNKCGRARLNFGNCFEENENYPNHYVQVNLNNIEIGQAKAGVANKTIEFDFKDGDVLELRDIDASSIKFNDFVIISCVKC